MKFNPNESQISSNFKVLNQLTANEGRIVKLKLNREESSVIASVPATRAQHVCFSPRLLRPSGSLLPTVLSSVSPRITGSPGGAWLNALSHITHTHTSSSDWRRSWERNGPNTSLTSTTIDQFSSATIEPFSVPWIIRPTRLSPK